MLAELIELIKLIFLLPVAYWYDFMGYLEKRIEAKRQASLTEEEKAEEERLAKERVAEKIRKEEEERQRILDSIRIETHIPYSHYQKKRW